MAYRGRFAPSPTGALHLGSAAAAIFAAAAAGHARGELLLRVDDLDAPRVKGGALEAILDDLAWLGIRFEASHGVIRQSERGEAYEAAVVGLARAGRTYLCDCSRAEIASVASAPHAGDEGLAYPGTCRAFGMRDRAFKRPPSVRVRMPEGELVAFREGARGLVEAVIEPGSDFVIKRGDGVFAYQLACVVDDLASGITDVVRGADLAPSALRQAWLARALGREPPSFTHVPLLVARDGRRLAKRDEATPLAFHRGRGVDADAMIRAIASAYGHPLEEGGSALAELTEIFDASRLPGEPVNVGVVVGMLGGQR